jgi:tetratricopeptide (TPR) repeat protein
VSEEQIRTLLQRADEAAGQPAFGPVSIARIRQRIHRRWIITTAAPLAAAAVVLIGIGILIVCTRPGQPLPQPQRIASLEAQIKQLRAQTDATLRLVQEVLATDRQERHLASLEAELATIPDPRLEIERQVDKTAFILIYQADRLYKELNQTESAVAAYKEVIHLFPKNRWADVARERLSQIEHRQINKSDRKGEPTCEPGTV